MGREHSTDAISILHVDDDHDLSEMVATFLEREDDRFSVETADSAGEGLNRLRETDVDCIVSDYDMAGRNGIEFLEAVREEYPDLPFILYTSKGSEKVASDAISAGVTDYLQKEHGSTQYAVLANRIRNAVEKFTAEAELAEREKHLNLFFEQSLLGVIEWDEESNLVRMNESATDILGYTRDDLRGDSWRRIVPESSRDAVDTIVSDLLENRGGYHSVNENVRKDGERIVCEWHNRVVTDGDEEVVAIFSQFQDITKRKRRQQAIEDLHQTAHELFETDSVDDVAEIVVDVTRDILDMPSNAVHLYDVSRDELRPVAATDHAADLVGEIPAFGRGEGLAWEVFETGEPQVHEDVSTVPGRDAPDTEIQSEILLPLSGHGVLIVASPDPRVFDETDISLAHTLTAHATTALDQIDRERRLEGLQKCIQTLMRTSTKEETAQVAVETAHEVLGAPLSGVHLLGDDPNKLDPVAFVDTVRDELGDPPSYDRSAEDDPISPVIWDVFERGEPLTINDTREYGEFARETPARSGIVYPLRDYGVFIVSATESNAFDDTDQALIGIVAASLTTALDRVEQDWSLTDRKWNLEQSNGLLSTLFETLPVGVTVLDSEGEIIKENQRAETVLGRTESEITGRRYDDPQWSIVDEDGDPVPKEDLPFARVVETGEPVFDVEHGIRWPDGSERWLSINAAPLTTDSGGVDQVVSVLTDITDQRAYERTIEEQNERLEGFTSVVSHDLRNPLAVAQGHLELAREGGDDDHLEKVAWAHDRMQTLIENLLGLAWDGEDVAAFKPVDLARLAEDCWTTVETADATLVAEVDRAIQADESRLKQLFENLYRNGVEHGGDDVTVTIGELEDGFYVEDDGPGIPEANHQAVFERGYSTSESGMGLGLSIVKQVVEAHDWEIRVTEGSTGGARFEITGVEFAT
jgi:PAS domain S-box-containing protein